MPKSKTQPPELIFQITVIIKTWTDPEDRDAGIDVSTQYNYAASKKEAEVMIEQMTRGVENPVQLLGFYQRINTVVQYLE